MRPERALDNRTPWAIAVEQMDDPEGRALAVVIVKASWEIDDDGQARIAIDQAPVRPVWVDGPEPGDSSYPSDLAPIKRGTDVVLVGTAHPPRDREVIRMNVSLRIARGGHFLVDKSVVVHGARLWEKGVTGIGPGPAKPLGPTPLSWRNTFGGRFERDGRQHVDHRNYDGFGAGPPSAWVGRPAPPIESPDAPLTSRNPAPAGFGAIPAAWEPRRARFGTCDEQWFAERHPLPPLDLDLRYYSVAPDDQWVAEPLAGGEAVEIVGVRPGKPWRFAVPPCGIGFVSRIAGEEKAHQSHLDTFLIDADAGRVELTFRMAVRLPRKAEKVEWIRAFSRPLLDPALIADLAARKRAAST